nr:ribonuclease H-like domain-containing protein [Tanacetum cinerariifolium]
MTDYSLWEVILNGDSPVHTRIVEGVSQPVAPTTAEQQLARKNELKAHGLDQIHDRLQKLVSQLEIHGVSFSQEDVNLKFLRSLPSEWKTHTLIWRNKANLEEQNLDALFNSVQIYETKVKQSSFSGTATQNLAFVSSPSTDSVSAAASVSAACVKFPASSLPNIDVDDLEEMDLRWQMAMLTMRARRKGHFARECSYDWSYQAEEELENFALMAFLSNSSSDNETKAPQVVPSFAQSSEHVKSSRHSIQPLETSILAATPTPASPKSNSSGKRRNRKACFVCKSVDHLIQDCNFHAKQMTKPIQRNHGNKGCHTQHITHRPSSKSSNLTPRVTAVKAPVVSATQVKQGTWALKDKGVIDNGSSWHVTGNISYLSAFKELNGGYVAFGGNPKGGKITGKGKIKIGKLDFNDVYFVKELKFNLFSVSQMCDKKNSVLFTDTECLALSPDFKLPDENQVLLKVPRENNMYNVNLKNIVSSGDLTCLFAKATLDESKLWHRRLGHINFKTINKLVK